MRQAEQSALVELFVDCLQAEAAGAFEGTASEA